ncbi:HPr family phosphocarrier protein [Helicobacter kayseriensis]|uniref:HPr family phosphocarrier protein n=1 Tax=Helicobacter kayseriensis TaxID=2905877 RepID=UPI001E55C572|nr:HPr family phosphocarrier protein [Helicobacter kayseriensis]MCE3046840.1 HPr family phosphocarrier protein [Helicobacter kayseriensis]MCE3047858.1 HPr family phosphocarrier protein [Helicobacter kayseriensis]
MKEIKHIIKDPQGIHARPAGALVKKASEFKSNILLSKGEKQVDAKRILGVMSLGAKEGEELTFLLQGEDEDRAYCELQEFLKEHF